MAPMVFVRGVRALQVFGDIASGFQILSLVSNDDLNDENDDPMYMNSPSDLFSCCALLFQVNRGRTSCINKQSLIGLITHGPRSRQRDEHLHG